jgi:hypothetical protein
VTFTLGKSGYLSFTSSNSGPPIVTPAIEIARAPLEAPRVGLIARTLRSVIIDGQKRGADCDSAADRSRSRYVVNHGCALVWKSPRLCKLCDPALASLIVLSMYSPYDFEDAPMHLHASRTPLPFFIVITCLLVMSSNSRYRCSTFILALVTFTCCNSDLLY